MPKISLPFRSQFDRLGSAWASLSERERRILALMGVATVLFVAALGFTSLRKSIGSREAAIASKTQSMERIGLLAEGYREAEQARQRMEARINGRTVCRGVSEGMLFSFEEMLAYISQDETITPGEFLGSGTVGNGCGLENGHFLADGDEIELEVERIGILRNRIAAPHG